MCFFVDEWECKFEGDEIPLEVCKTCIEARSSRLKAEKITVEPSAEYSQRKKISSVEPQSEERKDDIKSFDEETKKRRLKELDNKFNRGKLSVDEYIQKRKDLNV
ncbi:MAG: hypothetical protein ACOCTR_06140 [Candidatus Natronoplasma sp.]